jgi:hypothetical protein
MAPIPLHLRAKRTGRRFGGGFVRCQRRIALTQQTQLTQSVLLSPMGAHSVNCVSSVTAASGDIRGTEQGAKRRPASACPTVPPLS